MLKEFPFTPHSKSMRQIPMIHLEECLDCTAAAEPATRWTRKLTVGSTQPSPSLQARVLGLTPSRPTEETADALRLWEEQSHLPGRVPGRERPSGSDPSLLPDYLLLCFLRVLHLLKNRFIKY